MKNSLRGIRSPINGKPIFINERLPPKDKEVQVYANKELNLKTATNNCAVKLEIVNDAGMKSFVEVKSKKEVDNLAGKATKKINNYKGHSSKREREITPEKSWINDIKNCTDEEEMLRICKALVANASPFDKSRLVSKETH